MWHNNRAESYKRIKHMDVGRLQLLHDHLSSGHLYATHFDIRVYKRVFINKQKEVIHRGCAIGEMVYIFPDSWKWLYGKSTVTVTKAFEDFPRMKRETENVGKYQYPVMTDVAQFLDIPREIVYILFDTWLTPNSPLSNHLKEKNFVALTNKSNVYDICRNIESCLYLTKQEQTAISKMWYG